MTDQTEDKTYGAAFRVPRRCMALVTKVVADQGGETVKHGGSSVTG